MTDVAYDNECLSEEIAAYLDGELHGAALQSFETHLAACFRCAAELRTQKQLLCTLDAAFSEPLRFKLPENFTRVVQVHAESNIAGMRGKIERRRAVQICAILAVGSFGLLGVTSKTFVLQPARKFIEVIAGLFELFWQTTYDAGTAVAVIARMVGRSLLASRYGVGFLFLFIFAIAISLLPRLIARYHRAQI